jgi:3-hydroxybutyryl-CoA dehydrogenase
MSSYLLRDRPVAVIGAGVMGIGIVQVALLAGHPVQLFDTREGAAAAAASQLGQTLGKLVDKGRLGRVEVDAALGRLRIAGTLGDLGDAALVVEAIVENLAVKQSLLRDLEGIVADGCVLASNTSSLSITALARGLRVPGRVVGMHFFNPVPLMKLVEVVSGLATDPAAAQGVHDLARHWGKTPVHARSTPGFIVNRIARPYYAETLALLQEQAATPAVLDACLRGAGFRMGPCELMDLIGHDTNFAVTHSVYEANFQDKRFQPSLVQREMVDGGLLGRKSGRGFYRYEGDAAGGAQATGAQPAAMPADPAALAGRHLVLHGTGPVAELLSARLEAAGLAFTRAAATEQTLAGYAGLGAGPGAAREAAVALRVGDGLLMPTDGRSASECAATLGSADLALFDWPVGPAGAAVPAGAAASAAGAPAALAFAVAEQASEGFAARAAACLQALGWQPQRLADVPGLAVARTIAMLINEASDAVEQGVCDEAGADAAMTLGVNYPAGPFAWLAACGVPATVRLIDALDAHYRGERYRVSPRLRRAAWART